MDHYRWNAIERYTRRVKGRISVKSFASFISEKLFVNLLYLSFLVQNIMQFYNPTILSTILFSFPSSFLQRIILESNHLLHREEKRVHPKRTIGKKIRYQKFHHCRNPKNRLPTNPLPESPTGSSPSLLYSTSHWDDHPRSR